MIGLLFIKPFSEVTEISYSLVDCGLRFLDLIVFCVRLAIGQSSRTCVELGRIGTGNRWSRVRDMHNKFDEFELLRTN